MVVWRSGRSTVAATLGLVLVAGAASSTAVPSDRAGQPQARHASALPDRLSDADFWALAGELSEPGGYFRIEDNFTSNELEVGRLATMLRKRGVSGGVYLGVGPEQNFSYIAAVRPRMAFIVDIRRQAALQHLMFKAIFEMAADRAEFISLLFAKPKPAVASDATIHQIWTAYDTVATDTDLAAKTSRRIIAHLTGTRKFALEDDEAGRLQTVYTAFVNYGPAISTRGVSFGRGGGRGVTFADLTGWSYDADGVPQSFLSSDDHFRFVKSMHDRNLIVPVTGDFGGPKAIRAIAAYLKPRALVTAFYVSNVEQYLFQDGKERAFYDNVATLPRTDDTVFIRAYALRRFGTESQALCRVTSFLAAVTAGRVSTNNDATACPQAGPW